MTSAALGSDGTVLLDPVWLARARCSVAPTFRIDVHKTWMLAMLVPSDALGGSPVSFVEAFNAYDFPSRDGDGAANAGLGTMELFGWGVDQSYRKALDHFRSAHDRGHSRGSTGLGILYANGYGRVVPQEFERAFTLLTAGSVAVRNGNIARGTCGPTVRGGNRAIGVPTALTSHETFIVCVDHGCVNA